MLFLLKQFEDVLVDFKSIKPYFATDDDFNWNSGIACASAADFREAKGGLVAGSERQVLIRDVLLELLVPLLRHSQGAVAGLGEVRQIGHHQRVLQLVAPNRERLLQDWQRLRRARGLGPRPRVLGGEARRRHKRLSEGGRGEVGRGKLQEVVNILRSMSNPKVECMVKRVIKPRCRESEVGLDV